MSYEWGRAGMEIPRRNTLSNANTKRDPAMAEDVFWWLFRHLGAIEPDFVSKNYSGYLARIRNHRLYALDSSTIQLVPLPSHLVSATSASLRLCVKKSVGCYWTGHLTHGELRTRRRAQDVAVRRKVRGAGRAVRR
ncbi:MAG: hypothetical protein ILM98_03065 [Kiritimatiellae bacterium]|nr:hypothetical protein [Kiritimatiellia bacterium]